MKEKGEEAEKAAENEENGRATATMRGLTNDSRQQQTGGQANTNCRRGVVYMGRYGHELPREYGQDRYQCAAPWCSPALLCPSDSRIDDAVGMASVLPVLPM